MTQSVVAVFESREQAETARQQLIAAGIPADRMSLHQGSESGATSAASGRTSSAEESESGIGHFFRSISASTMIVRPTTKKQRGAVT
jgi:hypothetical protein